MTSIPQNDGYQCHCFVGGWLEFMSSANISKFHFKEPSRCFISEPKTRNGGVPVNTGKSTNDVRPDNVDFKIIEFLAQRADVVHRHPQGKVVFRSRY